MKLTTFESSIELNGRVLPINTNSKRKQGCYVEILKRTEFTLDMMLQRYCKIFVVQFVFHPGEHEQKNSLISDLFRVIKKQLERKYRSQLAYGWVRETGKNNKQHYHVVLILNGNAVNRQHGIREKIFKIFETRDQTHPAFNKKSHFISRNKPETFNEAFYHLSYIAKITSKGKKSKTTNEYSFTRPKKPIFQQKSMQSKNANAPNLGALENESGQEKP